MSLVKMEQVGAVRRLTLDRRFEEAGVLKRQNIEPGALASGLQKSTDRALRGLRSYFT